jgi:hypothetical protein
MLARKPCVGGVVCVMGIILYGDTNIRLQVNNCTFLECDASGCSRGLLRYIIPPNGSTVVLSGFSVFYYG